MLLYSRKPRKHIRRKVWYVYIFSIISSQNFRQIKIITILFLARWNLYGWNLFIFNILCTDMELFFRVVKFFTNGQMIVDCLMTFLNSLQLRDSLIFHNPNFLKIFYCCLTVNFEIASMSSSWKVSLKSNLTSLYYLCLSFHPHIIKRETCFRSKS